MTPSEVKEKIRIYGLYRLYWVGGGVSSAAVGGDAAGKIWFAATNWITVPSFDWSIVESVELIDVAPRREEKRLAELICGDGVACYVIDGDGDKQDALNAAIAACHQEDV